MAVPDLIHITRFPEQPRFLIAFVHGALRARALFIKHFLPPRQLPKNMPPFDSDTDYISVKDGEPPRMHPVLYVHPLREAINCRLLMYG